ncbi:MAG: crossover junction endodeoxyribonuclease RuvC [Nannocystaceae bacterium]
MLGIDPGTRVVGYGVIDVLAAGIRYIECGVLRVDPAEAMARRLRLIADGIAEVIDEHRPTVVALESAFHGVNAMSALKLGLARGAVMVTAARVDLEVVEYPPALVKKAIVGHGRATKQEIQARVRAICQLHREPSSDAADALAIAICHGHTGAAPTVRPTTRRAPRPGGPKDR